MQALLYADVVNKTLSLLPGGDPFSWQKLIQGEDVRVALRFTDRVNGRTVEVDRTVESLRVTLSKDDARPDKGVFSFKVGGGSPVIGTNVTSELQFNATKDQVKAAFDALSVLTADQKPVIVDWIAGSWRLLLKDGSQVTVSLAENRLHPISFLRSRVQEVDGKTVHDLRLVQSPVAFTDTVATVVPNAPTIESVIAGGGSAGVEWNEVQKLTVPPAFRGSYVIKRSGKQTRRLSVEDGSEEAAEALAPLADEDSEFVLTDTTGNSAFIEFTGSMGGVDQPLLEIEVFDAPPGDPTFTLSLDRAELGTLLNAEAIAKLSLELRLVLQNEQDAEILETLIIRQNVEVIRELGWDGLAAAQNIDWLRPPLPRNYRPFTEDQIAVGVAHSDPVLLGDGVLTVFTIDHNLDSELVEVRIRENTTPGKLLSQGVDFEVDIEGPNSVTVQLLGDYATTPPAVNALVAGVIGYDQASHYEEHMHTIAEVVGLQTILDGHDSDIAELQALLGVGDFSADLAAGSTSPIVSWELAPMAVFYPLRKPLEAADLASLAKLDEKLLPRTAGLLPAVHDAATEALTVPLPTNPAEGTYEGNVYENTSGDVVELPGSLGRRTVKLKAGQFAAVLIEAGRVSWYRVAKLDAAKSTFYPTDFDRELFSFPVNDKQLRAGKKLTVQFGIEVKLYKSNVKARWRLRIEHGAILADSTPGTPDVNVDQVQWNTDSPILDQPIDLDTTAAVHQAGCVITRSAEAITAIGLLYGASQAAGSAPATANFYLRARLCGFDTEDNESDPRGIIGLRGLDISTGGAENTALGKAVITSA